MSSSRAEAARATDLLQIDSNLTRACDRDSSCRTVHGWLPQGHSKVLLSSVTPECPANEEESSLRFVNSRCHTNVSNDSDGPRSRHIQELPRSLMRIAFTSHNQGKPENDETEDLS